CARAIGVIIPYFDSW
nr:immunoglobulin heavy chain junction region [Macaca mulatta]MOW88827.1 immunoglobulin heavy chain junction region [Macaca mulatta]MOW89499.1 immunoglobulin heavy chain junction region [Macaca mulatta]MOW90557.1 immunoglobulin heavy chain junction region [Macaca mulatta]MOW91357.1 immunoglobulin heavy chain junction region [Macaca mulatta]